MRTVLVSLSVLALTVACGTGPTPKIEVDPLRPVRIAVRASGSTHEISTLSYKGGFEPKTLLYETLVQRDTDGRIAPALAQSWRAEAGGREWVFELRANAKFHDGNPVTAEAVCEHFRRWVGLPEHDWLACNRHIAAVRADGPATLRIVLDEPRALLPDLCAINPCAIRAPSTLDFEGNFVAPVGSGPFAWAGMELGGRVLHYTLRQRSGKDGLVQSCVDLVRFVNEPPDEPVDRLLAGDIDVVMDGWRERIPRERLSALRSDSRVCVVESPGSSVVSLTFRTEQGPCADARLRRTIRGALRRAELVERVEAGQADVCHALYAPSVKVWPVGGTLADPETPRMPRPGAPLKLLARANSDYQPALARQIADQLRKANLPVDVVLLQGETLARAVESGAFDMRIETTWGVPYDPDISLAARFGTPLVRAASEGPPAWGRDAQMTELVLASQREPDEARRSEIYARLQARIDETAIVIPLYVPRRFCVYRAGLSAPLLDHDLYRIDAASLAPATVVRQP